MRTKCPCFLVFAPYTYTSHARITEYTFSPCHACGVYSAKKGFASVGKSLACGLSSGVELLYKAS